MSFLRLSMSLISNCCMCIKTQVNFAQLVSENSTYTILSIHAKKV